MGGDVLDAATDVMMLRKCYKGKQEANCEQSDKFFHVRPFFERPKDSTDGWVQAQLARDGQWPVVSDCYPANPVPRSRFELTPDPCYH